MQVQTSETTVFDREKNELLTDRKMTLSAPNTSDKQLLTQSYLSDGALYHKLNGSWSAELVTAAEQEGLADVQPGELAHDHGQDVGAPRAGIDVEEDGRPHRRQGRGEDELQHLLVRQGPGQGEDVLQPLGEPGEEQAASQRQRQGGQTKFF